MGVKGGPRVEIGEAKEIETEHIRYLYHKSGNPIDEAELIQDLMKSRTQKEVAKLLGLSQGQISKRLRLLTLQPELQRRLRSSALRPSTAYALTTLPKEIQKEYVSHEKITLKDVKQKRRNHTVSHEIMEHLKHPTTYNPRTVTCPKCGHQISIGEEP